MQGVGFVHDMMDVKALILFVMARVNYPATEQQIYELCFQNEFLSYFDVCTAIPQMVCSGHLAQDGEQFTITEKGRSDGSVVEGTVPFSVRQRAEDAVLRFNREIHRSSFVKTRVEEKPSGDYGVVLELSDEISCLMTMELTAPNQRQAVRLQKLMEKKAEAVYNLAMAELLDEEEELED